MKIWKIGPLALLLFAVACSTGRPGAVLSPRRLGPLDRPAQPIALQPQVQNRQQLQPVQEIPEPQDDAMNRLFDFERQEPLPYTRSDTDFVAYQRRVFEEERPVVEIERVHTALPASNVEVEAPKGYDGFLRIAVLSPASAGDVAVEIRNAATLAMFNVRSDRVLLQFYDSKGTAEGARSAARTAVAEGAKVIVGPLFADEVRGVKSASPGIPVVSFTTDQSVLGSGVFSIGYLLEQQVKRMVEFAAANGKERFAIVLPRGRAGDFIRGVFKKYANAAGASIVADETYTKDTAVRTIERISDFARREREYKQYVEDVKRRLNYMHALRDSRPEEYEVAFDVEQYSSADEEVASLERISDELSRRTTISDPDYDAIFIHGDDINDVIMLGSTLMYYDVHPDRIRFMGTAQLENPRIFSERAFRGAWFPSISTRYSPQFEAAYKQYFGQTPSRIASLAYDTVALVATVGGQGHLDNFAILNPNGWTGINGVFRFKSDGSSERNIDVREVVGGRTGTRVISPAATSFIEHR